MTKAISILILILGHSTLMAQLGQFTGEFTLPEIALIRIEPDNSDITLTLDAPSEAGAMNLSTVSYAAKRIIYTSALPLLSTRKITAEKTFGTIPAGTKFYLIVSNSSTGSGELGTGLGEIEIPDTGQVDIISNIGSSFTGTGTSAGHAIDYKLSVTNMSQLRSSNSESIGITFTIIENL